MSDLMLIGVLSMPYEMAMGDDLSRLQFWQRAQQAAQRIQSDADRIADLERQLAGASANAAKQERRKSMATEREIQLVEAALKAAAAECEQWNATPGSRLAKQIRSLDPAAIVASVPQEGITIEQAREMGAKGAPATDAERKLFEAWMAGHCWALCSEWDGESYRGKSERGEYLDPRAMNTRQLWAAWRDRAALSAQEQVEPTDAEIAQAFHEAYERLAPSFGYETREASRKPWAHVPENNRALMIAVCGEVRALLSANQGK